MELFLWFVFFFLCPLCRSGNGRKNGMVIFGIRIVRLNWIFFSELRDVAQGNR